MKKPPFIQKSAEPDTPENNDALALRLLRQGKVRAALDRAKSLHKAGPTPQSETFLLQCYAARAREMRESGHSAEADALCAFVGENFPGRDLGAVGSPLELRPKPAAVPGTIAEVLSKSDALAAALKRLADPGLSEDDRRAAEGTVAELVFNPPALAEHPLLTPEHPLTVPARAVAKAFQAAVTRTVTDAEIALPEVSHRSPLAGWKLLIRAIAHMQRREDAPAREALERLAAITGAPAGLVPKLLLILGDKGDKLEGEFRRIFSPWRSREQRLPAALERVDRLLARFSPQGDLAFLHPNKACKVEKELAAALRGAAEAVRLEAPDRAGVFSEAVVSRALMLTEMSLPEIEKALGGPAVRSASFWRLAGLAMEGRLALWDDQDAVGDLCTAWDRYRRHGVAEGVFPAGGREEAEVYRHLARMLMDFDTYRRGVFTLEIHKFAADYCYGPEQPEGVRALKPDAKTQIFPPDPAYLLGEAARLAPTPEIYRDWLDAAHLLQGVGPARAGGHPSQNFPKRVSPEYVLQAWTQALPKDTTPWLILMQEAENRNALTVAQKHLAVAEAIDPMNADLKRGKWRLVLAVCRRHLKQGKAHLVMADVVALKDLQRFGPSRADWLLAGLDWVVASRLAEVSQKLHLRLVDLLGGGEAGEVAASLLKSGILGASHQSLYPRELLMTPPPALEKAAQVMPVAIGVTRLLEQCGFSFGWGKKSKWPEWFIKTAELVPKKDLPFLAETMLPGGHYKELFTLTAITLAEKEKSNFTGRALYIRALALKSGKTNQNLRIQLCLRAAAEIARRTNDRVVLDSVTAIVRKEGESPQALVGPGETLAPLPDDQLDEVAAIERKNSAFPSGRSLDPYEDSCFAGYFDDDDFADVEDVCQCPECRKRREGKNPLGLNALDQAFEEVKDDYLDEFQSIMRDMGLSKAGSRTIAEIIVKTLAMKFMMGEDIGNSFYDFTVKEPDILNKIMAALSGMTPEDRRLIEEGVASALSGSLSGSNRAGRNIGKRRR